MAVLFRLGRLVLRSTVDLGLLPAEGEAFDIAFSVHRDERQPFYPKAAPDTHPSDWLSPFKAVDSVVLLEARPISQGYLLRYADVADFYVLDEGGRVEVYPESTTPPHTVRHLLLAQVWPLLLSLRGRLVLHASAVRLGNRAVAFTGPSGHGKSTLAASFTRCGCRLLTDDVLALEARGEGIHAEPSYAEQRLWEDSAVALFGPSRRRASVAHYTDKVSVDRVLDDFQFEPAPLPLACIYVLEPPDLDTEADGVRIEPLSLKEAYVGLLDQTFRLDTTDAKRMRLEVKQLADLVRTVPVRRLSYPRRYDALDRVRQAILDDVEAD